MTFMKVIWKSIFPSCYKGGYPSTKPKKVVATKPSSSHRISVTDLSYPSTTFSEDLSISLAGTNLHVFTLAELKVITQHFSSSNFLGEGGFGPVHKGFIDDRVKPGLKAQSVAVKLLDLDGTQGHKEWLTEVVFLGQLRHPHLVKLIGYCCEEDHRLLVYEYLPRGSLENQLFRRYSASLPWSTRMKIAVGAAKGLAFLHEAEKQVIYRDFKASNILLDSDYNAKLSDLGLAKDGPEGDDTHVSTRIMGTQGYAAPEYVMTGHLTAMSDVYSFGVVLLELLTGRRSVDKTRPPREQNLVEWARPMLNDSRKLGRIMDPRLEGQYSEMGTKKAAALAYQCLSHRPRNRPTMSTVVKVLEPLQDFDDIPIGPFVYTVPNDHNGVQKDAKEHESPKERRRESGGGGGHDHSRNHQHNNRHRRPHPLNSPKSPRPQSQSQSSHSHSHINRSVIPSEPSWQEIRALGMGYWYASVPQLRTRMEKLARAQYLKSKNPKDCALLYIALNRIQVLAGLFKISKDEKDKPLMGFLSRNFQDEKNKAAALKNAYVLLGKHQLELAIAFFLLGGDHSSAINVCAKNLGDEQLALVICRLVEGRGGPLERHLITKYMLPSVIDKGDYWLASLLEWEMGNYYQSFHRMLEFSINPVAQESIVMSNRGPFLDPSAGLYCQMLATNNSLRNAVGEQNSAILLRWATLMTVTSLKRCGNPLEALEYFSSSLSMLGIADQGSELGDRHDVLSSTLKPSPRKSSNWLSADVSVHLEFHMKMNLALKYLSKLIREHPSWLETYAESNGEAPCSDECMIQYEKSVESFKQRLNTGLALFEQRFSLAPCPLVSMIILFLCHHGLLYIGNDMAGGCTPGELSQKKSDIFDAFSLYRSRVKPFFKTAEEISFFYSRFFAACSMEYSQQSLTFLEKFVRTESRSKFFNALQCQFGGILISLRYLRAILRIQLRSISTDLIQKQDLIQKHLDILDLFEYYLHFSLAWLQRNSEALLLMVEPFLIAHDNGRNPYEIDMMNVKKHIPKVAELLAQHSFINSIQNFQASSCTEVEKVAVTKHSIPDDERWKILGACLWQHMSRFMISNLNLVLDKLEDDNLSGSFHGKFVFGEPTLMNMDSNSISLPEQIRLVSFSLCDLLVTTVTHISSHHVKQLAEFLWLKVENNLNVMTLEWLRQPFQSESLQTQDLDILELVNRKDKYLVHQLLWDHCANPKLISECFAQEKLYFSNYLDHMPTKRWNDLYILLTGLHKADDIHDTESELNTRSPSHEVGSPVKGMFQSGHASSSNRKDLTSTNTAVFHNPREMYKRNGELLEALCVNSTDQREAAVASNRKGIVFFHLEDETSFRDKLSDLLWAKADWPQNGWAGSESTPAPTCVSPGVGLGNKKGAHLGLGGATVGVDSSAWPNRDLTGGGALGVLGYAGIGAYRLGWGIQEDFEDIVDPPATLENISTRALSSHPMRPFFLVGSSNTHIYLWEFNKDKATATYGLLPAADVPPPYALASISALKFDHFGHRFASAALDGTVCTWQLEVGGRSNVRPTESSLCFNGHASDITYFSSSGSIIAVAGYSSNAVNVVIWDTLAPPTTSRASILCHEGGARALSVFDSHVGSGSVSPIIVTGGKGGDVGLHDFRYIATGKAKRHRHADNVGKSSNTASSSDKDQNVDGMLWYIPKAHSGSVTKVVTIPNTSLFLTGSTDGDVKLWDAHSTKLIHHWSKMHEKHTFVQPSSRGFGSVVRAAVTDIQVVPHGFLSCGGDGTVKLVRLNNHLDGHGVKL